MTTTMDADGTITIPQEVIEEAGLKPGKPLEITARDGLEKRGRLTVLVPEEPIREERMKQILGEIESSS